MSTCFLKRFLPFMLTLVVGLGLGSIFHHRHPRTQFTTRLYVENSCHRTTTTTTATTTTLDAANASTPLAILFEPPTHMTAAALKHQTYGVVELLVEYGTDGHAHVIDRLTTLPDGLTEEAERVAEQAQFRPRAINGVPVSTTLVQSYYFDMSRY
jgi:hypothetical protein